MLNGESIASADIPLGVDQFIKPQPITIPIKLYTPFDNANPSLTYSLSYTPLQDLPKKDCPYAQHIFAYLTYNPPLQLNTQDVHLFVKKVENNGTVADILITKNLSLDPEANKCGPSGLTQVFYLNRAENPNTNFFFYIWATGYTGRVTLNFATAPDMICSANHDDYCLLNNSFFVDVNNQGQPYPVYALFPCLFLHTRTDFTFKPKQVPPEISPKLSTADSNKPESEAIEKSIITCAFQFLYPNKEPILRLGVSTGRRFSLKEAAERNGMTNPINKLLLSFSFNGKVDESFSVIMSGDGGEAAKHFIFYNRQDPKEMMYFMGYITDGGYGPSCTRLVIKLNEIPPEFNYLAIYLTFALRQKYGKGFNVIKRNIYSSANCSVQDFDTHKELMGFEMPNHTSPVHFLVMILHRNSNNEWDVCPMTRFYDHLNCFSAEQYRCADTLGLFKDFARTEEFNRLYND